MQKIGKYEVAEVIGKGGFGVVYRGRDPFLDRVVAIKTCASKSEEIRLRFFREARIAGSLHHANIVTVHDFGIDGDTPYLVQEFIEGEDLDRKIWAGQPLTFAHKLGYLIQIAEGLDYAHSKGVVHRDIKPGNLRVAADGVVKIMDFGIARLSHVESDLTQKGIALGTVTYLSPEQLQGASLDHRSDIFSFGVTAYELLAYRLPFDAKSVTGVFREILYNDPRPLSESVPNCSLPLEAVIRRCLEKEPEKRYPKFSLVAADLRRVRDQLDDETLSTTTTRIIPALHLAAAAPPSSGSSDPVLKSLRRLAEKARTAVAAGDLTSAELTIELARREHAQSGVFEAFFAPLVEEAATLRRRREAEIQQLEEAAKQAEAADVTKQVDQARAEIEARLLSGQLELARAALERVRRELPETAQAFASLQHRVELQERARRIEEAVAESQRLAESGKLEAGSQVLRSALALEPGSARLRAALREIEDR